MNKTLDKKSYALYNDKTMDKQQFNKSIFRFLLALAVAAFAVTVALIVFCFLYAKELELLQCLLVGVAVVTMIVLSTLAVWRGIVAYRE